MPITLEDIEAMRYRIKAEAEVHQKGLRDAQEGLAALETMERRVRAENATAPSMTLPGVETEAPPQPPQIPFAQAVRDAVQDLKGIEFTVSDVEETLRKRGRQLPLKNARTRITLELIPLAQKGVLTRTFRGTGKVPNRYRLSEVRLRPMSAQTH